MTTRHNPKTTAGSAKAGPWDQLERAHVCALYLTIRGHCIGPDADLTKAAAVRIARGEPKPGAEQEHVANQSLRGTLARRSKGSIEAKLMNISAALDIIMRDSTDAATVQAASNISLRRHGYKSLPNMQADLLDDVRAMLRVGLEAAARFGDTG